MVEHAEDRDFIQSLDRGLAVIRSFSRERPQQSIAEVAGRTGISRAAARRVLHTLERLGYAQAEGSNRYALAPAVLGLGFSYLSALDLPELARPAMERLVAAVDYYCSLSILDRGEVTYVARIPSKRMLTVALTIGSRFPAHLTAMGHVLLAALPDAEIEAYLDAVALQPITPFTTLDRTALHDEILQARRQGYAVTGRQLVDAVWSMAAPIRDGSGRTRAAISLTIHTPALDLAALRGKELPLLLAAAEAISMTLGAQPRESA